MLNESLVVDCIEGKRLDTNLVFVHMKTLDANFHFISFLGIQEQLR